MSVLDLNNCFPEPPKGVARGPLPKQQEFMKAALDTKGPSYVLYSGGVGSGKTLIGCITILTMAIMESGDYLVCRLFNPELKLTTYKTFLEICPPELIIEHRVADQIVKIRSQDGKVSNVIFRGMEDPGKHRSLNLNAAYLDECSQISEEGFTLLQSRLRGRAFRKIIATTNPNGHSWLYRYWIKKDWANPAMKARFLSLNAPSTENIHLPDGYVQSMLDGWSQERIDREVMGSWDSFSGQIYGEFSRNTHVVKPFVIPAEWTRFVGGDHGLTNPACFLWCAMDYDGTIYVYKEFYHKEWIIEDICKGNRHAPEGEDRRGLVELNGNDKIEGIWLDPSTKAKRDANGSHYDTYLEHLPRTWSLIPANNAVGAGIDRIKELLKVNPISKKPKLFIFDTCVNLLEELTQYRWAELTPGQEMAKNAKEEPVKKDDHSCFLPGFTRVATPSGGVDISELSVGSEVMTSLGYRKVLAVGQTGVKPVYRYDFTDGSYLACTADHPVLLSTGEKKPVNDLTPFDTVAKLSICRLSLMALFLGKLETIIGLTARPVQRVLNLYIEKCGSFLKELFPHSTTSTTEMEILTTMTFQTWNVYQQQSTSLNTPLLLKPSADQKRGKSTSSLLGHSQSFGTEVQREENGIGNMLSALLRKCSYLQLQKLAPFVASLLKLRLSWPSGQSSVTRTVRPRLFVGVEPVWNLSVEGVSEFYANGILVSNCDALRYAIMSRPEEPKTQDISAKRRQAPTLEGSILRELHDLKKGVGYKDPWGEKYEVDSGLKDD